MPRAVAGGLGTNLIKLIYVYIYRDLNYVLCTFWAARSLNSICCFRKLTSFDEIFTLVLGLAATLTSAEPPKAATSCKGITCNMYKSWKC